MLLQIQPPLNFTFFLSTKIITSNDHMVDLICLTMGQGGIGFPFCQNSSSIVLPLPNSQILIITNSHFSFQQIITTNKILEIYIVISLLKLPSFVCYKRLGCLMHSHIPTPQKKFKSHTHIRKPMSSGWSSSFQVSCHTHTRYCILSHSFYSQSFMVLSFFKF